MAASRRRVSAPRRVHRRRAAPALTTPPADPPPTPSALDRALALPAIDSVLGRLLAHPHLVQITGALSGCLLIALTLRALFLPTLASAPLSAPVVSTQPQPLAPSTDDQAVVNVVAAYNQASITAAVLNRADAMAPYLAPNGRAWADVQAEYQRRARRGETHDPALTRWGILRMAVNADTAMVETQEQWDDLTSVGGQVVSSQRGILTHNSYDLRRSPSVGSWLITTITTTSVMN
jgi:hypothetical protein